MATPALNNGIFLRQTEVKTSSNIDQYHLVDMLKSVEPMDMGPVDLWAMAQQVKMPLYQFSNFGGRNTIMVDNARGEYKWQVPIAQDLPYFMGDIEPTNTKKGIDGQTFQVKINKRAFGHGDMFTYDKFNGVEFFVVPEADIVPAGDGFIYTVQLVNNDSYKFLDNKYLKEGTKVFRIGSARSGEYGERFSDIGEISQGYREYYNFVGGHEAHVEYSISSKADLMIRNGMKAGDVMPVIELWRNFDKTIDPSISNLETLAQKMGPDYVKRSMAQGTLTRSFLTNMEAAHLTKIANDIETYLMWGKGGRLKQDGPDEIRMSKGLWAQTDNGYKRVYNRGQFNLDLFKSEIFNYYAGKVDFKGPDSGRQLIIQTGLAGMRLVDQAIKREVFGSGLVLNATDIGALTGNAMDLGFGMAFTQYKIPFLANIKFVVNPAFDNYHQSDIENPIIDGYPLSSYSFIVFDVTENSNDNIYLLKLGWDNQLKWHYMNGTMDYMGRNGHQATGAFSGYKVRMSQTMPSIWIKDPTRVMKIVMRNPVTGGTF